jgi:hypothetical protein
MTKDVDRHSDNYTNGDIAHKKAQNNYIAPKSKFFSPKIAPFY